MCERCHAQQRVSPPPPPLPSPRTASTKHSGAHFVASVWARSVGGNEVRWCCWPCEHFFCADPTVWSEISIARMLHLLHDRRPGPGTERRHGRINVSSRVWRRVAARPPPPTRTSSHFIYIHVPLSSLFMLAPAGRTVTCACISMRTRICRRGDVLSARFIWLEGGGGGWLEMRWHNLFERM